MKRNLINCLVTKSNVEVTMSFSQWRAYENGELNLAQIKMINDVDFEIFKLDANMYRSLVLVIAIVLFAIVKCSVVLAVPCAVGLNTIPICTTGLEAIPALGNRFLDIIRVGMYWVCLVKACSEVGREVTRGGDNIGNIGKIIITYTLYFATLYILPTCFDMVKEAFAQ